MVPDTPKRPKQERVQVNVSLPVEQITELRRISEAMRLGNHGVTALIRIAVGIYVGNEPEAAE